MSSLLLRFASLGHLQIGLLACGLLLQGALLAVVPEEVVMLALGFAWRSGRIGFFEAWLFVLAGLLPANFFMFQLGRRLGVIALERRPFRWLVPRRAVEAARLRAAAHGQALAFLTRFTPTVRAPVYFALGVSRLAPARFFRADFLGALIHVPALLWLGGRITNGGALPSWRAVAGAAALALAIACVVIALRLAVGKALSRQSAQSMY